MAKAELFAVLDGDQPDLFLAYINKYVSKVANMSVIYFFLLECFSYMTLLKMIVAVCFLLQYTKPDLKRQQISSLLCTSIQ